MTDSQVPGYALGDESIPDAPIDDEEFEHLRETVLLTEEDEEYLRMAGDVLDGQIDDLVDTWYEFVADHAFLLRYYEYPDGGANEEYLDRVYERFGQWVRDTCDPPYDRDWLNYQFEIGRRHHRTKKNETDDVESVPNIDLRYVIGLIVPVTLTTREFLANGDHSEEEVEKMYRAWFKSVALQVSIWSHPYAGEDW